MNHEYYTPVDYSVISNESILSPLLNLSGDVKNSFMKLMNNISDNIAKLSNNIGFIAVNTKRDTYKLNERKLSEQIRSVTYVDFKELNYMVPVGYKAENWLDYLNALTTYAEHFLKHDLVKETLNPTNDLLLALLGDPSKLTNINPKDYKEIYLIDHESYKDEIGKFYNMKQQHQSHPFGKLYKNMQNVHETLPKFQLAYYQLDKLIGQRKFIVKAQESVLKTLDKLLIRIESNPEKYQINALNAERLASLMDNVARTIELCAVIQVKLDEAIALTWEHYSRIDRYQNGSKQ